MIMMVISMAVRLTLSAGGRAFQSTIQIATHCLPHCSGSTSCRFNAKLAEELDCSPPHTAAKHDICPLLVDKPWHLSWLMGRIIGIINDLD